MRIDPKHFNKFIAICAAVTIIAILFSTIRYSQKQTTDFQDRVQDVDFRSLSFYSFSEQDSLRMDNLVDRPVIIHFWSTWSGKSQHVNQFLREYSDQNDNLYIIAAAVRDDSGLIMDYINTNNFPFHFVEGTEFYQSVFVPGMPTQILLDSDGALHSTQIGDDIETLQNLLNELL